MSRPGEWAHHITVSAMAHMLGRGITIVTSMPSTQDGEVLQEIRPPNCQGDPLLLGLIGQMHYQSLDIGMCVHDDSLHIEHPSTGDQYKIYLSYM